jgi:ABC-type bacteriocin/lantibiotic exporter with double-glycine peptidase domain
MRNNTSILVFSNHIVSRSFSILTKIDRIKISILIFIQISLSFLDLAGVAIIGMIGALTVNGSASREPGNRVSRVLEFLNLENLALPQQVAILGLAAAALLILKTLLTIYLTRRTMFFLGNRAALLTKDLIYRLLNQSLQEIRQRSIQENIYLITGGVHQITNGIISAVISLSADIILLVVLFAGLFYVDSLVALITTLIFTGIALLLYLFTHKRARKLGERQASLTIRGIEMIHEILGSFREAVVGGRRGYYSESIGRKQHQLARNQAELAFLPTISKYVLEITIVLGFLVISAVAFNNNDAARSVAILSVFLASSTRIGPAVLRIQQVSISMKSASGAALPTLDLIEKLSKQQVNKDKVNNFNNTHPDFEGTVIVEGVNFTYDENSEPTLTGINLNIKPGTTVALVGRSGSGKTTLADMILGILIPNDGQVRISGLKPTETYQRYPGAIAYVPQEVFIANGSVRVNVCLGFDVDEISDELIWEALDVAQLKEVVAKLPKQLDTLIGDRGSKLSGGQRQRLGIARSIITKPKLLVLDEATSALDSQTELNLTDSIFDAKGKSTLIIIAHRLSTVKKSDLVVYMDNGKVISSGTFDQVRSQVPDFDSQAKLLGF